MGVGAGVPVTSAGAASSSSASVAAAAARPNILWLVSEDNNPSSARTATGWPTRPTLDRLAAEGILYRHAYSTAPVCAPSRFALITGMYAQSCGPAHNMRASGKIPSFLRGFPEYLRAAGYYCTNNAKTDYNAPINISRTWNASGTGAHWRNRPAGAPFFAVFNTDADARVQDLRRGARHGRPGRRAGAGVPAGQRRGPAGPGRLLRAGPPDGLGDRRPAGRTGRGRGWPSDTIVFYLSDNGGVLPRSKRHCYEDGLRTALIVRVPPRWRHLAPVGPGSVVTAAGELHRPGPDRARAGRGDAPAHLQGSAFLGAGRSATGTYAFGGRNRMDERYDLVRTVTDGRYRYIRNYAPHRPWGQHVAYAWQQQGYQAWEQAHLDGRLPEVQDRFWRDEAGRGAVRPDRRPGPGDQPGRRAAHAAALVRGCARRCATT